MMAQSRLPSRFQEVEYINIDQSKGVSYIDTLTSFESSNPRIETKYKSMNRNRSSHFVSGKNSNLWFHPQKTRYFCVINGQSAIKNTPASDADEQAVLSDGTLYVNNSFVLNYTIGSPPITGFIRLFNYVERPLTSTYAFDGLLYYLRIYDDKTLCFDFVPCYRKIDNEVGLYDTVNKVFYGSKSPGAFTAGPPV